MGLPIALAILVFEFFLLAVVVDGILRLVFGIKIHTGQPEDSVVVLIFAGALVLCLAVAALALGRKRWRGRGSVMRDARRGLTGGNQA